MTKQEYMAALSQRLKNYPQEFRDDILEAFELHFSDGLAQGKSEEEVMQELGSVDEVIADLGEINGGSGETVVDWQKRRQAAEEKQQSSDQMIDSFADATRAFARSMAEFGRSIGRSVRQAVEAGSFEEEEDGQPLETVRGQVETPVRRLAIQAPQTGCDVALHPAETMDWEFRPIKTLFSSAVPQIAVSEADGEAVFLVKSEPSGGRAKLSIGVPQDVEVVHVNGTSGNFSAGQLTLQELGLKLTSGDIRLTGLSAGKIYYETHSGDVELSSGGCGTLQGRMTSGDFTAEDWEGDLSVTTVSGDLELDNVSGTCVISTTSGDISLDQCTGAALQVQTASGDVEVADGDYRQMNAVVTSGDADIECTRSLVRADIATTSGDIDLTVKGIDDAQVMMTTVTGELENHSALATREEEKHLLVAGEGETKIFLKSVAGDITLN